MHLPGVSRQAGHPFKVEMSSFFQADQRVLLPISDEGREGSALWVQLSCYSSVFQIKHFSGCSVLC